MRKELLNACVLLSIGLIVSACSPTADSDNEDKADPGAQAPALSLFKADIAPLLQSSCATCHLTGQEAGNLSLIADKARESLVGVKSVGAPTLIRVVPGDPDKSYLMMKLQGTHIEQGGIGVRMPFGAPPLNEDKMAKLRQWIKDGAKE